MTGEGKAQGVVRPRPEDGNGMPSGKKAKKQKVQSPEGALRTAIQDAVSTRDPDAGWAAFESRGELALHTDQLANLLFLFTGQNTWADHLAVPIPGVEPATPAAPLATLYLDRAAAVAAAIQTAAPKTEKASSTRVKPKHKSNEMLCVGMARVHALSGDAQAAYDLADRLATDSPTQVRLRTYVPALAAFVKAGDAEGAMRVHARAQALCSMDSFVDETEAEYTLLLQAVCVSGTYAQLRTLLCDMGQSLGELARPALAVLEAYFGSERARAALSQEGLAQAGASAWEAQWVDVDPTADGTIAWAAAQLREVSLSEADWAVFATGLQAMASRSEKQNGEFDKFVKWLEHNPCDVLLDGANIALFGQNFTQGGFSWRQVKDVFDAAQRARPGKRVAVILHTGRYHAPPSREPAARAFIERLQANKQLYITPRGSNDDWYWLYGVVSRGKEGMLVSNDQMRDHIFELMRPQYFRKWRSHHQYKFNFTPNLEAELIAPPRYTTCVQWLPEAHAWAFPQSPSRWLCVKPKRD